MVFYWLIQLLIAFGFGVQGSLRVRREDRELLTWPWPLPWQNGAPPITVNPMVRPYEYPFYTQCDQKWGKVIMQKDDICKVGCFLSSISMALAGRGLKIPTGLVPTPATLNYWLQKQTNPAGYLDTDILNTPVLTAISPKIKLGANYMHRTNDLKAGDVVKLMAAGKVVIANVHDGRHFVLLVGYPKNGPYSNSTVFAAQDPALFATSYTHQSISGYRIFTM